VFHLLKVVESLTKNCDQFFCGLITKVMRKRINLGKLGRTENEKAIAYTIRDAGGEFGFKVLRRKGFRDQG
jgi:hypothetical protein